MQARTRVYALNPQGPEITLFESSVAVCIQQGLFEAITCYLIVSGMATSKAFCLGEDFFVAGVFRDAPFYA